MIKGVEHVGIFVRDLDAAIENYASRLGIKPRVVEDLMVDGGLARLAFLPAGETDIELIQAEGAAPGADVLNDRPAALHHIALEVDDLEAMVKELQSKGVKFLTDGVLNGSRGTRVIFFQPEEFNGIAVELVEKAQGL